jgi:hypothetical protein
MRQISAALASTVLMLLPSSALAHGGSHSPDPNLHVEPSLDECEVHFAPELTQAAYRRFVREFGLLGAFKQMAPPRPLGQWKVSAGVEYMKFHIDEKAEAWNDTFSHPTADHELGSDLAFPKLKVRLGVTDATDVGVFFSMAPRGNYGWIGADIKHAVLRQSEDVPLVVAVRGAYTKTLFVSDMDMHAMTADVSAGHVFWNTMTPYLGVGGDLIVARETASTVDLRTEVIPAPHAFAGVEVAFWHVAIGVEGHYAAVPSAHLQVAAVF